jgi:N-acetylglucosamine-6-phosphate deacetylase
MTIISARQIITPQEILNDSCLIIEDGIICAIEKNNGSIKGKECIAFDDAVITPGLIDLHIHGSLYADTMDANAQALNTMSKFLAEHGVTGFLATTMTADPASIRSAINTVKECMDHLEGAALLGVHLEGPYLDEKYRGAQPRDRLRLPDPEEYRPWFDSGVVKLMTLAPELEGSDKLISYGIKNGVQFSVGHSSASYDQVIRAADLGLSQATHTFNGMPALHHREPGPVGAVLTDPRIYAQIIADGVHLHPAIIRLIIHAKGMEKTILITDAIEAAGLADGEYNLGGTAVHVQDGVARISSGSLAGSTLTLDQAVRNVMKFADLSLQDAVSMATSTPAVAMGWQTARGFIRVGGDADLAVIDARDQVIATFVRGKLVFRK